MSLIGLAIMLIYSTLYSNAITVVSCSIYGTTLVLMYSSSTLYHWVNCPHKKKILRIIDHSAIYLLIAGSYTPFCLLLLEPAWGWSLFGVVWGLALFGIVWKAIFMGRYPIVSIIIYIAMGWLAVFAAKPFYINFKGGGLNLLLLGGIVYTTGVIFYAFKKIPYNHAIWHLFVLGGSTIQYFSILFYLIWVC